MEKEKRTVKILSETWRKIKAISLAEEKPIYMVIRDLAALWQKKK